MKKSLRKMIEYLIIIITFITFLYSFAIYHNGYWKRRGIQGPKSKPFFGNIRDWSFQNPMVFQIKKWTKKYGKVYGIQEGIFNILVISDVNLLHEVFVKKFEYFHGRKIVPIAGNVAKEPRVHMFNAQGPRWKRLRSIANPVFSVNNLKKILPTMYDSTDTMLNFLDKAYHKNEFIDIHHYYHELALDIIMRIAMGQRESLIFQNEYFEVISKIFEGLGNSNIMKTSWIIGKKLSQIFRKILMSTAKIRGEPFSILISKIQKEVDNRKIFRSKNNEIETENKIIDFIDLFLNVETNENNLDGNNNSKTFQRAISQISKRLTIDEVISQCFLFLLAGFDTTSNTLTITTHFLVNNQFVQDRLREEIMEICPEGEPTYEQLNKLKYAESVMKETLRLGPIAAFAASRTCAETTTIGDYIIEAGTIIQADVLSVQQDKEIWGENADKFYPERWLDGTASTNPLTWLPFGAGPRICIGMKLAYLEEKIVLVYILRKYRLLKTEKSTDKIELNGNSVMNPSNVIIKLELIN